jgi:hypothetical protein
MINLLTETLEVLTKNGKSEKDIIWLGCDDFQITWENFKEVAAKADYDNGYGSSQVAPNLKIVGNGFVMIRGEYDGSEWWDYYGTSETPIKTLKITALTINQADEDLRDTTLSCGWEDLAKINGIELDEEVGEDYEQLIQRQMTDDCNRQIGIGINNNK